MKNAHFFVREEDRMTSLGSIFPCGRPHGADTSACIHRSL